MENHQVERKNFPFRFTIPALAAGLFSALFIPRPTPAVPMFARRYNLKCYACHTIPPVLNENGYMFKRLGYHLPPALGVCGATGNQELEIGLDCFDHGFFESLLPA